MDRCSIICIIYWCAGRLLPFFPYLVQIIWNWKIIYMYLDTYKYYLDKFLEMELLDPRKCTLCQSYIYFSQQSPSSHTLLCDPGVGIYKLPFPSCLASWLLFWFHPGRYCLINLQNGCFSLNSHQQCMKGPLSRFMECFVVFFNTTLGPPSRPSEYESGGVGPGHLCFSRSITGDQHGQRRTLF